MFLCMCVLGYDERPQKVENQSISFASEVVQSGQDERSNSLLMLSGQFRGVD